MVHVHPPFLSQKEAEKDERNDFFTNLRAYVVKGEFGFIEARLFRLDLARHQRQYK